MEKLTEQDGMSLNVVNENLKALKNLFPEAFTEDGVDFEVLRQLLGDEVSESEEKFGLNWFGKMKSRQIALEPSMGTLRPCFEESIDWATTQNLFIEGDNLEVLKLLQRSYSGKIKMIYIDPPYNTGGEFIYPDKYRDNLTTYLLYTNQKNADGFFTTSNTESSGRFHTNWINMLYPRLKLARNLLRDDGIIFISIDDNELVNLCCIGDSVFGEENRIGIVNVVSNLKGRSDDKYFATAHNYLVCYKKDSFEQFGVPLPLEYIDDYQETDDDGKKFRLQGLRKRGSSARRVDRPKMYYTFWGCGEDGSVSLEESAEHTIPIVPVLSNGEDGRWRWGKETSKERINELICKPVGPEGRYDVFQIDYAENKRITPKSVWIGPQFANESGTLEIKKLLPQGVFETPKPLGLIKYCLEQATKEDDIVLDFFAGSATTGHAVYQQNIEDGGNRRFILVQLPEKCAQKSEAYKAGYHTIAEISRARLSKASEELKENLAGIPQDLGFKVLKLDSSNIVAWNPDKSDLEQTLIGHTEHLVPGRSEQDVLYELLLKRGVELTVPIEEKEISGKTVYSIGFGALFACLDKQIGRDQIEDLAQGIIDWHKELDPVSETQVVFRDSAFENDIAKTNITAILEQGGIKHARSL